MAYGIIASCVRFYYVLFLADEADIWYYMADSLNWCNIEIYAGKYHSFNMPYQNR